MKPRQQQRASAYYHIKTSHNRVSSPRSLMDTNGDRQNRVTTGCDQHLAFKSSRVSHARTQVVVIRIPGRRARSRGCAVRSCCMTPNQRLTRQPFCLLHQLVREATARLPPTRASRRHAAIGTSCSRRRHNAWRQHVPPARTLLGTAWRACRCCHNYSRHLRSPRHACCTPHSVITPLRHNPCVITLALPFVLSFAMHVFVQTQSRAPRVAGRGRAGGARLRLRLLRHAIGMPQLRAGGSGSCRVYQRGVGASNLEGGRT